MTSTLKQSSRDINTWSDLTISFAAESNFSANVLSGLAFCATGENFWLTFIYHTEFCRKYESLLGISWIKREQEHTLKKRSSACLKMSLTGSELLQFFPVLS